ncbi:MAG: hypothetical protein JWO13_904 [Acidobacteriales bacterium]|nr:hypothetical protein [Terriglobales bacterium]
MKRNLAACLAILVLTLPSVAAPISNAAKAAIPGDIQQLIVVDYRTLNASATALALKDKVLPPPLKQFEAALRGAGINPEQDVEQLVFASYRVKDGLRVVGIAQGEFAGQKIKARLLKQKVKGTKYRLSTIYPMSAGMFMTLVDDYTMIFGDTSVVKNALDARDGEAKSLNSNGTITDMMAGIENETVWSILDKAGTQTMLKSALGDAAQVADYEMVKNRLVGSRYNIKFTNGFNFDLDVITSDNFTAATLSSILKMGVMFRKATANDTEKMALDSVSVKSDSKDLMLHFKADDNKFQALLNSELFTAVSR